MNAEISVAASPPVVSVSERGPVAAAGSIKSTAVALVALITVNVETVIPGPKLAAVLPCAKFVPVPVITTFTVWPCRPLAGATERSAAEPVEIVNALAAVAVSAPVTMVTLRDPVNAMGSTVIAAVAVVRLVTVREFTVMPVPNEAVVVPCAKCVNCPAMATFSDAPCCEAAGVRDVMAGVPAPTVKAFRATADSPTVERVTVRAPDMAFEAMTRATEAVVEPVTATLETVMPGPKSAEVMPLRKCVPMPVTATVNVCPWTPLAGKIDESAAGPELTVNAAAEVATELPVARVMERVPGNAVGSTVMNTVADTGLFTVTEFTIMLAPKVARVVPWTKLVLTPVMATFSDWPWAPKLGETDVSDATPGVTDIPLASTITSAPEVIVTAWLPRAALGSMAN